MTNLCFTTGMNFFELQKKFFKEKLNDCISEGNFNCSY